MSKVKIEGNASGTGTFTIAAPNSNTDRTFNLPDEAGTVLTSASDVAASQIVDALNATGSAPIYACRAWVNFNGNGTVAIRASGNVSSITDHAAGDYTVNFTTAMPDANYAPQITFGQNGNSNPSYTPIVFELGQSTTSSRLQTNGATGGKADVSIVCVAVFR
jgi:hypothetical protein